MDAFRPFAASVGYTTAMYLIAYAASTPGIQYVHSFFGGLLVVFATLLTAGE